MDVQRGRAETVRLVPEAPMPAPVATVYDSESQSIATPTATPSTVVAVVVAHADATRQRVKLSTVAGVYHGLTLRFVHDAFGIARSVVSGLEGDGWVRLVEALPLVPADGAVVEGLDVEVALPAFADYAIGHVLELTNGDVAPARVDLNVVRYPFIGPCTAEHVRDLFQRFYSGERGVLGDVQLQVRIAREVNVQIQARLLASSAYISEFWSPTALQGVRPTMLRLVLAEQYGMYESGADRGFYLKECRDEISRGIERVSKGKQLRDPNKDGKIELPEREGGGQNAGRFER